MSSSRCPRWRSRRSRDWKWQGILDSEIVNESANNKNNKKGTHVKLLGITGPARSGKDTIGNYVVDKYGFVRYAMAWPLKEMVKVGLGLDPNDYETNDQKEAVIPWLGCSVRHVWQTLGTDWGRVCINEDLWLILAERTIKKVIGMGVPGVVITDLRFENELAMVRRMGGVVLHVKTKRKSNLSDQARAHASEAGVVVGPFDRVLANDDSLEELYQRVEVFMHSLRMSAAWQEGVPA